MRNKCVQLELSCEDVMSAMEENDYKLITLLEKYLDFDALIPVSFMHSFPKKQKKHQWQNSSISTDISAMLTRQALSQTDWALSDIFLFLMPLSENSIRILFHRNLTILTKIKKLVILQHWSRFFPISFICIQNFPILLSSEMLLLIPMTIMPCSEMNRLQFKNFSSFVIAYSYQKNNWLFKRKKAVGFVHLSQKICRFYELFKQL